MTYSIEAAKREAREAVREMFPNAIEVFEPCEGMYEFDAVYTDDEECGIASVSIMYDERSNTFALMLIPYKPKPDRVKLPTVSSEKIDPRNIDWDRLAEEHEIAYFRGHLATSSPESYSIDEMKTISDDMLASTAEVDAALKADFESMSPEAQDKMLDLLQKADPEHFEWWKETLLGKIPDAPPND